MGKGEEMGREMMIGQRASATICGVKARKEVSVQQILEWAFRRERVQLELDGRVEAEGHRPGVSTIWVMIQRGNLGCKIDGGGTSEPHEDAEVVAAAVANLSIGCGGKSMAVQVAELARAGMTPDWMPGAKPKIVPAEWHTNRYGRRAKAERLTEAQSGWPCDARACMITWSPSASSIARARRAYLGWYGALLDIRASLVAGRMLRAHQLTDAMPPREPWKKGA